MCYFIDLYTLELVTHLWLPHSALFIHFPEALSCYYCPRTYGKSEDEANIECLAIAWEMSCADDQVTCDSSNICYQSNSAETI